MRAADVVLFVVDVTTGITDEDAQVAKLLQQSATPAIVVVNKVDDERREADMWEFQRLGLGEPMPVSAIHGRLSGELLDAIVAALPEADEDDDDWEAATRPTRSTTASSTSRSSAARTSGKSTLFNRLVGEDRAVVHDMPGTDPRRDRHRRRDRGRAAAVRRHRRPAPQEPHRRADRVLQPRARARSDRPRRRRAARDRRDRRRDPPGSTAGRAHRRRRAPRW